MAHKFDFGVDKARQEGSRILYRNQYNSLCDDTKKKLGQYALNVKKYKFPSNVVQEIKDQTWYKSKVTRNTILTMIQRRQLAPIVDMEDNCIELSQSFDDSSNDSTCICCYSKPVDEYIGWNWIKCSDSKSSHLICTKCLLAQWDHNQKNNLRTIDVLNLKYQCKVCCRNSYSQIVFVEPEVEAIVNSIIKKVGKLPYHETTTLKKKHTPNCMYPINDENDFGTPTLLPSYVPPPTLHKQTRSKEESDYLMRLKPEIQQLFEIYEDIPILTFIPVNVMNDIDVGICEDKEITLAVLESVYGGFFG
ncbi:Zinc finger PHD-type domain-containing protein [Entamoeba marina]